LSGIVHLETEVFLAEVTHGHYDHSRDELAQEHMQVKQFHKKLQQKVVEHQVKGKRQKITHQLDPALEVGIHENHKFHEDKSHHKVYAEGNEKGGDMGFECEKTKIEVFLLQDELVADKIYQQAQYGICTAADGIPKGLFRHELPERRIKKINECYDPVF
jgi:hypothetical protein